MLSCKLNKLAKKIAPTYSLCWEIISILVSLASTFQFLGYVPPILMHVTLRLELDASFVCEDSPCGLSDDLLFLVSYSLGVYFHPGVLCTLNLCCNK